MTGLPFKRCSLLTLVVTASLTMGCHERVPQITGSRSAGFGASRLMTEYRKDPATNREVALLHVLFVSPVDPPAGRGFTVGSSSSGTVEKYAIDYTYYPPFGASIHSEPVRVLNGTTVKAADRSFSLQQGNVFVAEVNPQGKVHLTQLRLTLQEKAMTADAVLAAIKDLVPNPRVQALKSAR